MPINETGAAAYQGMITDFLQLNLGGYPAIIQSLIVIAAGYVAAKLFAFIGKKIVRHFTKKTKSDLDDLIVVAVYGCLSKVFFLGAFYVALFPLNLHPDVTAIIARMLLTAIYVVVIYYSFGIVNGTAEIWGHFAAKKIKIKNFKDQIFPFLKKTVKIIVFIIGVLLVLQLWGVNIGPFLASLGVAGIVLGFALKDTLSNIFGGISLILDNAYKVGDKVTLGSGETGFIQEIGLRSTRLKLFDGQQMMVPNGNLATTCIVNYNQPDLAQRVVVSFGVQYGTKIEEVENLLIPLLKKIPHGSTKNKPVVIFTAMGDWDLKCEAQVWVDDLEHWWNTKLETTRVVYDALESSKKISIPFPTQEIHLKK